ncbi:MAG: RIP metalloprotease RseP [Myxococcaceae bacterium]
MQLLSLLSGPLAFVVLLAVLIFVHELGHFWVAKACGVKVLKFSIGFGPSIFSFKRGETEYRLAWLPLGGYVKMAGEVPGEDIVPEDIPRSFQNQVWWKRAAIVVAGPVFNLVFPVIVFFFVLLGASQATVPKIGSVEPGLPAAEAKLRPGDVLLKVDDANVRTFEELRRLLGPRYGQQVRLTVKRGEEVFVTPLEPKRTVESNPIETVSRGMIGITAEARPAIVGVPEGSPAQQAGLQTFDRIVALNGEPVKDEVDLEKRLSAATGSLQVEVQRRDANNTATPLKVTLVVPRQEGSGYAALGAERADAYIHQVVPGSAAAGVGLQKGDRIVALDGQPIPSFLILSLALSEQGEKPFRLTWRRGAEEKTADLKLTRVARQDDMGSGATQLILGANPRIPLPGEVSEPEQLTIVRGPMDALRESLRIVPEIIHKTVLAIASLFTGKVPFKTVGGPILLYQLASKSAEQGVEQFVNLMAVISINLGLMNLLPVPVLDGFALLVALWDGLVLLLSRIGLVRLLSKIGIGVGPIPNRAREIANGIGLAMLLVLMVMVFKNDLTR